jgi:hypothetical protein
LRHSTESPAARQFPHSAPVPWFAIELKRSRPLDHALILIVPRPFGSFASVQPTGSNCMRLLSMSSFAQNRHYQVRYIGDVLKMPQTETSGPELSNILSL